MSKGPDAFRTISEVAEDLDVPQHVLRFWETRFPSIRPLKRGGGRRYYRPDDVDLLKGIRQLLYGQGYTIKGVQRILKEDGPRFVQAVGRGEETVSVRGDPGGDDGAADVDFPEDASGYGGPAAGPGRRDGDDERGSTDAVRPGPGPARLAPETLGRLQAALDELLECERVLAGLRAR